HDALPIYGRFRGALQIVWYFYLIGPQRNVERDLVVALHSRLGCRIGTDRPVTVDVVIVLVFQNWPQPSGGQRVLRVGFGHTRYVGNLYLVCYAPLLSGLTPDPPAGKSATAQEQN